MKKGMVIAVKVANNLGEALMNCPKKKPRELWVLAAFIVMLSAASSVDGSQQLADMIGAQEGTRTPTMLLAST